LEDHFRIVDHEERRVASRPARGHPQALEYNGKLRNPSFAELV
jgi:hypothetical protein